jgi:hypothetical protein
MKKMTKKELETIIEQHKLWLDSNETEGKCADLTSADLTGAYLSGADLTSADLTHANLSGAYLSGANLSGADLSGADLSRAYLYGADLRCADLTHADLSYANLRCANLSGAYLSGADLSGAYLSGADLSGANLYDADLSGAYLSGANLSGADLEYANLTDAILDEKEQCRKGIVLTEPMTGYKKAYGGKIITLEIPVGAKVFSINNNKRRTNKAKVIDMQGETELSSMHDNSFKYHVGDEIDIIDFDENYNVECSTGIHFFLTREEAENF